MTLQGTPARFWHMTDRGRLQCDLCPRGCQLQDGQQGLCFVRARQGDRMVLTTYGRASGIAVDPIEKKPLYHFLPGSKALSFGTIGCNLTCRFCQNWRISKSRSESDLWKPASPTEVAQMAADTGCESVAFTYNDPIIFHEYAVDVAQACRERGIRTVAVTAGYVNPEPRAEFFAAMDAANVDLKGFRDDFYRRLCGARLQPVLETLLYLKHNTSIWLELTTLLIPGENDSPEELDAMTRWAAASLGPDVPMHFTAFHPDWRLRSRTFTPAATLLRARETALANGLRYVYTGNIRDPQGNSTYCHHCGTLLIQRNGFAVTGWNLTDTGDCPHCGRPCAGVFD